VGGDPENTLSGKSVWNHPNKGDFWVFKNESILPRCTISKRLRYEKQIKALHLSRLLSLEMLHGRVEIEKQY
jgi:hypothetical protein